MPGGDEHAQYWENDTQEMTLDWFGTGPWPGSIDPNPYFGRVVYVHGLALDQPLGVIRMGYADLTDSARYPRPLRREVPFLISPLWNERGQAHVGVFADGGLRRCFTVDGYRRCVQITWPETWFAYHRPRAGIVSWHGTLIEDKQDATGTHFRRNRYYDPGTGRFTQEDPIGLAGGLNVYGYAAGDPANYADPYGLCPKHLRKASGRCPGNLTVAQWQFTEKVMTRGMRSAASVPLTRMLESGRIVANEPMRGSERRVQSVLKFDAPSYLRLGPVFYSQAFADAAFTLAHDYGHIVQRERLNLIYADPSEQMSATDWFELTRTPEDDGPGEAYFNAQQHDANRYACNVTLMKSRYHSYCRQ